ncbi:S8 family serine peptidase [Peribacillus sp. SCS-26]|uniref:S8 family serine peptidase n=1 Tax=Paraperibacillus marinus TaxID=3115295 RepID=UPI0039061962
MINLGKLLVGFRDQVSAITKDKLHRKLGTKIVKRYPQINVDVIEVPEGEEKKYRKLYLHLPDVVFVDFNYLRQPSCIPNDPYYLEPAPTTSDGPQGQWGLRRIKPERAFDKVKNLRSRARAAVLDTGIDPNHPDLREKIINPINFGSADPNDYIDRDGHGTHVAGILGAVTDNRTGVAGTSFNTSYIIPVRLGNDDFTSEAILDAIFYSIANGVDVINMSFGGPGYNQAEQNAIELAWNRGIVLVAAGGNEGHEVPSYPAAYNFVLGVSATDKEDRLAPFSNWGIYIGIAAPGTAILSTTQPYPVPNTLPNYDAMQGTSMAAPFVSGAAALLRALSPQVSNQEVVQAIQRSARPIDTDQKEWVPFYGYGLLNLSKAVRVLKKNRSHDWDPLGSFYGQAVDENNQPLENTTIIAFSKETNQEVREYMTKADGMFRLFNLPASSYLIGWVPEGSTEAETLIEDIEIVPGTDTFLKLVIEEIE